MGGAHSRYTFEKEIGHQCDSHGCKSGQGHNDPRPNEQKPAGKDSQPLEWIKNPEKVAPDTCGHEHCTHHGRRNGKDDVLFETRTVHGTTDRG